MKKVLLLVGCLTTSSLGLAQQKFSISVGTGLGTYRMYDLRAYEKHLDLGHREVINNFPPFFFWTGKFSMSLKNELRVGLAYGLYSTGYKSAYADYSGSVKAEHIIKCDNVGVIVAKQFWQGSHFSLSADVGLYYGWSEMKRQYTDEFYGPMAYHKSTFKYFSRSISMASNVAISYTLFERISLNGSLGLCYDFRGDLKRNTTSGSNHLPKVGQFDKASQSDWTGLRLGLSTTYSF